MVGVRHKLQPPDRIGGVLRITVVGQASLIHGAPAESWMRRRPPTSACKYLANAGCPLHESGSRSGSSRRGKVETAPERGNGLILQKCLDCLREMGLNLLSAQ